MKPTQVLNHLASILFERVNARRVKDQSVIAVRLGYGNRLTVPAGIEDGNKESDLSAGFLTLWLTGSDQLCKASGFRSVDELDGQTGYVTETENEARITVHARGCGAFDVLQTLKSEFFHVALELGLDADILSRPTFGTIVDVSALSTGDEFEDRAETTLTVKFRDTIASALPCVTVCSTEITKPETQEQETLCH